MAGFWRWTFRYPAWCLGGACIGLWLGGAIGADLAFTGAFLFSFVAYLAGFFVRRAEERAERKAAAIAYMQRPTLIPGLKGQHEPPRRKAA